MEVEVKLLHPRKVNGKVRPRGTVVSLPKIMANRLVSAQLAKYHRSDMVELPIDHEDEETPPEPADEEE